MPRNMVLRGWMLTGAMSLQLKVVERSQREPRNANHPVRGDAYSALWA
jgi:hypothetical protein